jgi:hypothetical protein
MTAIDTLEWEILDSTADDWENLQQIFLAVGCDVPDAVPQEKYGLVYTVKGFPRVGEVADGIVRLVEAGLLAAREEDGGAPVANLDDKSYVWRAWFAMTPAGRSAWESSEHAAAV